jgi:hypothetical protein
MLLLLIKNFGSQIEDLLLAFLIVSAVYFYGLIWWNIFNKAGYKPTNGLLMYIPFINLVMLAMLAFKEWPFASHEYMRSLRKAIWAERKGKMGDAISEYESGIEHIRKHILSLRERSVQDEEQRAIYKML